MSWSLSAVPLQIFGEDGGADWLASAASLRGMPDRIPDPRPLPSAALVLDAFREAGCHGVNWFTLLEEQPGGRLPECPERGGCLRDRDLGEVNVHIRDGADWRNGPLPADAGVSMVSFRKPHAAAVLRAVHALVQVAGPQLVFDDSMDMFVISPGEQLDQLRAEWPWGLP